MWTLIRLYLIVHFLFLAGGLTTGTGVVEKVLDQITSDWFDKPLSCSVLMSIGQRSKFIPKLPLVNYGFLDGDKISSNDFMKRLNALKCVITVVDALTNKSDNNATAVLKRVVFANKYFPNHLTVYAASREPPMHTLLELNRPLLWIKFHLNSLYQTGTIYCPRVGIPGEPSKFLFMASNKMRKGSYVFLKTLDVCTNPFKGQTIRSKDAKTIPKLLPNITPDQNRDLGFNPRILDLICHYLLCSYTLETSWKGSFRPNNLTYSNGRYHQLWIGNSDVTTGSLDSFQNNYFELSKYFYFGTILLFTRNPQPVETFSQLLSPFSPTVWVAVLSSLMLFAVLMHLSHGFYQLPDLRAHRLAKIEASSLNFYLFAMSKFTEPEPLPWFKEWSAGKLLAFLWALLALFVGFFYNSNLRAHLAKTAYESPPTTLREVLATKRTPFLYPYLKLSKAHLESISQTNTDVYKIQALAEKRKSLISLRDFGGRFPDYVHEEVLKDGAFTLAPNYFLPYYDKVYRGIRPEMLHSIEQPLDSILLCLAFRKNAPGMDKVNTIIGRALDMGLPWKWFHELLPMRAILKIKPKQAQLKPMEIKTFYSALMFYGTGAVIALVAFLLQHFG